MSQLTVAVEPTAAVACVPRVPTIAVSIYWTAVCINCSSMVGHARARMVISMLLSVIEPKGSLRCSLPMERSEFDKGVCFIKCSVRAFF